MLAVGVDAPAVRVVVLERPAVPGRDADPKPLVAAEGVDGCAVLARDLRRAVCRAVVDDEHVRVGDLRAQPVEHRGQIVLLVPRRDEDDGVGHTRSSSDCAARSCRLTAVSAPSSQTSTPGVGATRAVWKLTATPWWPKTLRKIHRARSRWSGVQTTTACAIPRSSKSGSVRAAFSAVVDAVSSTTSSRSPGCRQRARICAASETPSSGDHPLKTTIFAPRRAAACSASATTRRQSRLMRKEPPRADVLLPRATIAGGVIAQAYACGRHNDRTPPHRARLVVRLHGFRLFRQLRQLAAGSLSSLASPPKTAERRQR